MRSPRGAKPLFFNILLLPQGWLRGLFFIIGQPEVLICQLGS